MLEKVPAGIGRALRGVRSSHEKILSDAAAFAAAPAMIVVASSAFQDGQPIPH